MHTPDTQTQEVLVLQAQGGDEDAWATLVERYQGPLWGYIARLTNPEIALDLLQDTLIKAWQGLCRNQLDQLRTFEPWFYRIARHTSLDWLRRQRLERRYHIPWEAQEEEKESVPDVLDGVMRRDLVQRRIAP